MTYFIIGSLIFFGVHSVRIFAEDWRLSQIARLGLIPWKLLYGLVSAVGFGLIVWGFAMAKPDSAVIWIPPLWLRHAAALITLPAFVLIVAGYIPRNHIRARLGHPMVFGVALWALGHLAANGRLVDLLLFGAFLLWAAYDYLSALRRDKRTHTTYSAGTLGSTLVSTIIGFAGWILFAGYLHAMLIGVRPFG